MGYVIAPGVVVDMWEPNAAQRAYLDSLHGRPTPSGFERDRNLFHLGADYSVDGKALGITDWRQSDLGVYDDPASQRAYWNMAGEYIPPRRPWPSRVYEWLYRLFHWVD